MPLTSRKVDAIIKKFKDLNNLFTRYKLGEDQIGL